ncbi:L-threonylcarbamoyladenylate synthase [Spirulina sp. CS-785/01]|uniref:L-threonylcarbamoyladenylate synthase n=1 Tax=Spirulina sp. CS-785/01 TaxID=3021716 RepID=UPI00232BED5C|nr:L-threonylcarbamoyladenylate synthase [Spirulina sp. CS-785/01]MDB9312554.1 L-threonylcarbamoyladenylate synthase [Spirulina sp. CS-785/01]
MTQVSLSELIEAAKQGQLVSFPTDTVPALATCPPSAAKIFAAKQRAQTKPLILMGASWEDLLPYVQGTAEEVTLWQAMAQQYWPGALTLVLPASPRLPKTLNPQNPTTIGLRIPASPLACEILAATQPLATTSINRSGEPPLETLAAIETAFREIYTLKHPDVPRDAKMGSGLPSTVAKWTGKGWEILRQGSVVLPELSP